MNNVMKSSIQTIYIMYLLPHIYKKYMEARWISSFIILCLHQNDGLNNKLTQSTSNTYFDQVSAIYLQFMDAYLICKNIFLQYETPTH